MSRTRAIGERFGAAARHYDRHAPVQRVVADRLAGAHTTAELAGLLGPAPLVAVTSTTTVSPTSEAASV